MAIGAKIALPDRNLTLKGFVEELQKQAIELSPGSRIAVSVPDLAKDQLIVVMMNLYASKVPTDVGLSKRSATQMGDSSIDEGAGITMLYLVDKGEAQAREDVSMCSLAIDGGPGMVIRPGIKTVHLECAPLLIQTRPDECRHGVHWNAQCTAKLVIE